MPRQPFLPGFSNSNLVFGPAHIARKPKIAEAIGRCVVTWSYNEWLMALLLAAIMKANSRASVAIFLSLKNYRTQKDVLEAAANATLQDEDRDIFDAILIQYGSLQSQRADLAHGIFGHADIEGHEEIIPWIEAKDLSQDWLDQFHSGQARSSTNKSDNLRQKLRASTYSLNDLERMENDMRQLFKSQLLFYTHLNLPSEMNASTMRDDCKLPHMANALSRVRDRRART